MHNVLPQVLTTHCPSTVGATREVDWRYRENNDGARALRGDCRVRAVRRVDLRNTNISKSCSIAAENSPMCLNRAFAMWPHGNLLRFNTADTLQECMRKIIFMTLRRNIE